MDKRIIFMGTPIFAASLLQFLIDQNYNIIAVVSQPDKPSGRKKQVLATPVKEVANRSNILVIQPEKIKTAYQTIADLQPDLIITAAYGQFIPNEIINLPNIDCINVHGSLLPKYRGGAPIHYSVLNGDRRTGVTIMQMAQKMDAGDMISSKEFEIGENDTTSIVHDKMIEIAKQLLVETLPIIISGKYPLVKQDESKVTYSPNISKEQEKIDWKQSSQVIHNQIRGLNSWPGAYTTFGEKRFKIYESRKTKIKVQGVDVGTITQVDEDYIYVATKDFLIKLLVVQPFGKTKMKSKDYLKGLTNEQITHKQFR